MRWLHIGLKDLRITIRDKGALGVLLGMPIVLILILGSALGNVAKNIEKVPVAIVNLDRGHQGDEIADAFFKDAELRRMFLAKRMRDPAEARGMVESGDLAGALVIPADITKRLTTGKPCVLALYVDPGRPVTGAVFRSVTEAVSSRMSGIPVAARTAGFYGHLTPGSSGMAVVPRAVQKAQDPEALDTVKLVQTNAARGKEVSQLSYYSGAMSAMFIMFGAMFGAFSLLRERDTWTLPRMLTTPVARAEIVGGKMLGVFVIGLLQFTVLFTFTSMIGVQWGDAVGVFLVAAATVVAATGLSIFIAASAKTIRAVSGIAQMVIQAMSALGGSFIPVVAFPEWMRPLHYLTVNGWAIDGILASMRGGSAVSVLPNVGALLLMGVVFFAAGAFRLRLE